MQPEEIRAVGDVAGEAVGDLTTRVSEMHEGIAERVFSSIGPSAEPVRLIHDGIAHRVYSAVGGLSRSLVRAGAGALSVVGPPDAPAIEDSARGRFALGALNGAFGDKLAERRSPLALHMTLRCGGRDVRIGRDDLADAFPTATPRLVVFLHGLCETDEAWLIRSDRFTPYGPRLERELGYTPLYVRYNTGLHISENGRKLERRLSELVAAWPVEVGEIALIGHSMGGLVSRSACYYGLESDWVTKVRHVFTLGTPHGGAPLEQVVHAASCALASLPETRSLAQALNRRSVGIKDLRHGYLLEEDWTGHDPDAFIRRAAREVPFLSTANHYFVCATLSRDSDAPVGRVIGDLLVLRASAWAHGGKGRRMRFPVENYRHVGGATHFDLLNHPAIYDQISKWLGGARGLPAPAAA